MLSNFIALVSRVKTIQLLLLIRNTLMLPQRRLGKLNWILDYHFHVRYLTIYHYYC